ncbi:MAG: hypothetical protein WCH34_13625 [Bacteroidota bacterium]
MKKLILIISLITFCFTTQAQLKPDVVNSLGGSAQYAGGYLAYSVGEPIIGTATGTTTTISQGFLQTWHSLAKSISLNLYLEGLFDISSSKMVEAQDIDWGTGSTFPKYGVGIADRIQVDLFEENPPFNPVGVSISGIDLSTDGLATFQISPTNNGNYYIRVRTRNHLETWTAIAVPFNTATIVYDFTTNALKAYQAPGGLDPQVMVGDNLYAFYLGDLDQSMSVDFDDFNVFEPYLNEGTYGFNIADFNGNGLVDFDDFNLFEPRLNEGPFTQYPGM